MKTKVASLLVVLLISTISCTAQRRITVEAQNNDISNNLDLQAVASTFGESRDLEDFERRLNDYDSQISNLDLNNDGEVDYLRVIENMENNVHVVVIQAVLDRDVFQDVATIVVERRQNRRTVVQIIGDPYLYGNDYIIEPVYVYTPSIYSFFWGYNYQRWYSPYYYGYYPRYYRYRSPFEVNVYLSHVYSHINHNHRYYYSDRYRNEYAERLHNSMRRNDYGTRYPDRNFSSRNGSISNKREFDRTRSNNTIYERSGSSRQSRAIDNNTGSRNNSYESGSRNVERRNTDNSTNQRRNSDNSVNQRINTPSTNSRNSGVNRTQDDVYQNRTSRPENQGSRNNNSRVERNTQTYSAPANRSTEMNRNSNNGGYQQRPANNTNVERRQPAENRENTNTRPAPVMNQPSRQNENRPAPVVNQPSRSSEQRSVERKPAENNQNRESRSERGSRNNSERR
ncbi:MAG TPA: hypothetical protein VI413_12020 [Paludibacter sp.]